MSSLPTTHRAHVTHLYIHVTFGRDEIRTHDFPSSLTDTPNPRCLFVLGYACVVDMGDQKTSISCVEDGISHSETRIHLDYGGADITQASFEHQHKQHL